MQYIAILIKDCKSYLYFVNNLNGFGLKDLYPKQVMYKRQ